MESSAGRTALAIAMGLVLGGCGSGDNAGDMERLSMTKQSFSAERQVGPSIKNLGASAEAPFGEKDDCPREVSEQGKKAGTPIVHAKDREGNRLTCIRGDVFMQAMLQDKNPSGTAYDSNYARVMWLQPVHTLYSPMDGPTHIEPLTGSSILVTETLRDRPSVSAGQSSHAYEISIEPASVRTALSGTALEPSIVYHIDHETLEYYFYLTESGKAGDARSVAPARMVILPATVQTSRRQPRFVHGGPGTKTTKSNPYGKNRTILPDKYYSLSTSRYGHDNISSWEMSQKHTQNLALHRASHSKQGFQTCMSAKVEARLYHERWRTLRLCNVWEIPTGWTYGTPLQHLQQEMTISGTRYVDNGTNQTWYWSNKHHPHLTHRIEVLTSFSPISEHGINGSLLAALFESFTARVGGMWALPQRAGSATGPVSVVPVNNEPSFVSAFHESRIPQREHELRSRGTHEPTTDHYLYTLRTGAWQRNLGWNWSSSTDPYYPDVYYPQHTLALHISISPAGLMLSRWIGLHVLSWRNDLPYPELRWIYQGEPLSLEAQSRTIRPDELVFFGRTLMIWRDSRPYDEEWPGTTYVKLSVEQSDTADHRSVDLCWTTTPALQPTIKNCTTWHVPDGWEPGQPLIPKSYYAIRQYRDRFTSFWNTRASH